MATGRSSSMPHEMASPSSTLKHYTPATSPSKPATVVFKRPRPLGFHSEYIQIETATRNLPHNRPILQGTQVRPSFTGSLGSSHITTSASTFLEASFPQFELRMTSQTTTAVERQQNFLGRENHLERKSASAANFRPNLCHN